MDTVLEKIRQFSTDQYSNENRLNARIQLYQFCEHKNNWHQWIFNNLDFRNVTNVLDLGCGNGTMWKDNLDIIPEHISVTLSDISQGMVEAARKALSRCGNRFHFKVVDARRTPFNDAAFQIITAIHMIYHLDDDNRAFLEIDRLLTDNGFAYASTPSIKNIQQLTDIATKFNASLEFENDPILGFNLENGEEVLSEYFTVVEEYTYQNDIIIKSTEPLLLYLASIYEGKQLGIYIRMFEEFRNYVESIFKKTGEIRASNINALFKFRKK